MPLPAWVARFNRRVTNPALGPLAGRLPYFAIVEHRGRTSGRIYRTPVNAFPDGDRFLIALTYGRDVDWVKNVLTAGRCRLIHRRQTIDVANPNLVRLGDDGRPIPGWIRGLLGILGVDEALELTRA